MDDDTYSSILYCQLLWYFRVCKAAGIVSEDQKPICPIDAKGKFILPVKDFVGQYVKVYKQNNSNIIVKSN